MQKTKSRALMAVLDAEISRLSNLDPRATADLDLSTLKDSFIRLVEALALGPEPAPQRDRRCGKSGTRPAKALEYRRTKAPSVLGTDLRVMDHAGETRESTAPIALGLQATDQARWLAVPVAATLGCGSGCSVGKLYYEYQLSQQRDSLTHIQEELRDMTRQMGATAKLSGRLKSLDSIQHKMQRRQVAYDEILDLIGARVILATVDECYRLLDSVHARFESIDGCQRDYITKPKTNGYQSLHTTVRDDEGRPVEIQLRTAAMHDFSENGEAAHRLYKSGRQGA